MISEIKFFAKITIDSLDFFILIDKSCTWVNIPTHLFIMEILNIFSFSVYKLLETHLWISAFVFFTIYFENVSPLNLNIPSHFCHYKIVGLHISDTIFVIHFCKCYWWIFPFCSRNWPGFHNQGLSLNV